MGIEESAHALLWALRGRWHSTVPLESDPTIGALMRELDHALAHALEM